eukprot:382640_1
MSVRHCLINIYQLYFNYCYFGDIYSSSCFPLTLTLYLHCHDISSNCDDDMATIKHFLFSNGVSVLVVSYDDEHVIIFVNRFVIILYMLVIDEFIFDNVNVFLFCIIS